MFNFLEKMCAYMFGHKCLYVLSPFKEIANMQYLHPSVIYIVIGVEYYLKFKMKRILSF